MKYACPKHCRTCVFLLAQWETPATWGLLARWHFNSHRQVPFNNTVLIVQMLKGAHVTEHILKYLTKYFCNLM